MFEIYTFFENRTEIYTFFENRTEIYTCILFENRTEILSMVDGLTITLKFFKSEMSSSVAEEECDFAPLLLQVMENKRPWKTSSFPMKLKQN